MSREPESAEAISGRKPATAKFVTLEPATRALATPAALATEAEETAFEWRFGIRWRGRLCYLNIRLGAEQRSPQRRVAEGLVRLPLAFMVYASAFTLLFGVFGVVCFLYLLKSMAGIDILPGPSPLHPLYELFLD